MGHTGGLTYKDVVEATKENGGITVNIDTGHTVTAGLVVGGVTETIEIPVAEFTERRLMEAVTRITPAARVFGTWVHNGTVYVDACDIYDNHNDALRAAIARNEMAYFDLYNNWEIMVRPANMSRAA
jgi:hypothetical protein